MSAEKAVTPKELLKYKWKHVKGSEKYTHEIDIGKEKRSTIWDFSGEEIIKTHKFYENGVLIKKHKKRFNKENRTLIKAQFAAKKMKEGILILEQKTEIYRNFIGAGNKPDARLDTRCTVLLKDGIWFCEIQQTNIYNKKGHLDKINGLTITMENGARYEQKWKHITPTKKKCRPGTATSSLDVPHQPLDL
jgi:hypothetical protein